MAVSLEHLDWHPTPTGGRRALMDFVNGYSASVIQGGSAYTDDETEFEVAIMHSGRLCYSTPITGDVLAHLKAHEVVEVFNLIEALPRDPKPKPGKAGQACPTAFKPAVGVFETLASMGKRLSFLGTPERTDD